jgi:hypothetical protein
MDMVDFERRMRTLEDADAIRALKARYFFCCDRKDAKGMRACFADGPVHIDYGAIGTFDNADDLAKVFTEVGCHDHMVEMHHGMNPQIEMLLDGHRARGKWSLHYFLINTKENKLTQLAGYYEDEYKRIDPGGWKMTSTKFTPTSTLVLDLNGDTLKKVFAGKPG